MIRIHISTIALILLLGNIASARTMGSLAGTITDEHGKPVQFATIRILGTSPARGAITKENGSFLIPGITAGIYSIQITEVRYKARIQNDIHISADTTTTANVCLSLASLHIHSGTLYDPVSTTKGRTSNAAEISGETRTAIQGKNVVTSPSTHTTVAVSCIHYYRGRRATETSMRSENIGIAPSGFDDIRNAHLSDKHSNIPIRLGLVIVTAQEEPIARPERVGKQVTICSHCEEYQGTRNDFAEPADQDMNITYPELR